MQSRRVFLLSAVVAVTACGLSAVGEYLGPGGGPNGNDGGRPDLLPDGAPIDGSGTSDGGSLDGDASTFDAQGKCIEVCDAGTCDAGTCVIDCAGALKCLGAPVVCPPGVACNVTCGENSCNQAVDCQKATACNIDCNALNACQGGQVRCSGSQCNVTCGENACNQAVTCDAGTCNIQCPGLNACQGGRVICNSATACNVVCSGANTCNQAVGCEAGTCNLICSGIEACQGAQVTCAGDKCTVECGTDAGGAAAKDGCNDSVGCDASTSCNISCFSDNVCGGAPVVASAKNVTVVCNEDNTCANGIDIHAQDAGIFCRKSAACGTIQCDAGKCEATCLDDKPTTAQLCCATSNCVRHPDMGCDLSCP